MGDHAAVTGTGTDAYVVQFSYNPAAVSNGSNSLAIAVPSGTNYIGAYRTSSAGPSGGVEVLGAYDGNATVGHYGVDTVNHVAWAVVDKPGTLTIAQRFPGDTDFDAKVNNADFTNLSFNYGTTSGATWSQGDFTGDGKVNNADFTALSFNYGQSPTAGTPGAIAAATSAKLTSSAAPSAAGAPADGTMEIDIDASTGDVKIVANNVNLGNYDLIAINGDFDPNKWNMITTAGTNGKKFTVSTAQSANELQQGVLGKTNGVTLTGTYDLGNILPAGMTEAQYLADILDPNTPSQYAIGTTAKLVTPSVFVTSGVPEPTCLALGGVAAAGLLGRKRRRR